MLSFGTAVSASAQRIPDWRSWGQPTRSATATQPASSDGTTHWLRIRRQDGFYEAWLGNPLSGPVQLRLNSRSAGELQAVPALPVGKVLRAGEQVLASRLYLLDTQRDAQLDLWVEAVPGDPRGSAQDLLYQLPFKAPIRVEQGYNGAFSHRDAANHYAIDFALPEGTPVLAARPGIVMQVQEGFHNAGLDRERYGGKANTIRILHADGSMAIYAHLAPNGVLVKPGQSVRAGEQIGLSGNTGLSTAPHLHFAIQLNRGMHLVSVPFRMRGPLGELRFPVDDSGTSTNTSTQGARPL